MSQRDDIRRTLSLFVDEPTPGHAGWKCGGCGSGDVVLRLRNPDVHLTCTHTRIIGVTIDADDITECERAQCLDCGEVFSPRDGTA